MIGVTGLNALRIAPNRMQLNGLNQVAGGYHNDHAPLKRFINTRTTPVHAMVDEETVLGIMVHSNLRSQDS